MPVVAPLVGAAVGIGGSIISGNAAKKASKTAAAAQKAANDAAIAEQRRQFDISQQNFSPYLQAGTGALSQINTLLGISSPGTINYGAYAAANPDIAAAYNSGRVDKSQFPTLADYGKYHYQTYGQAEGRNIAPYTTGATGGASSQQAAIDQIKAGPYYQSLYRNGEQALLSNASATGGLRGGNMQGALYSLGADTLNAAIQQQLANLGGIAGMGQGAAGAVGNLGAGTANSISSLTQNTGATQGAAALARGAATGSIVSGIAGSLGTILNTGGIQKAAGNIFSGGGAPSNPIVMGGAYNNFMNGFSGIKL